MNVQKTVALYVIVIKAFTAWKISLFEVILVCIFPHLAWILRDTLYISLFFFPFCCGKTWVDHGPRLPCFRRRPWFYYRRLSKCAAFLFIFVRLFDVRRIDISIFCFPEVIMNAFLNDKILLQTFQMLFLWVDYFYFLCIFIIYDEQTFHYNKSCASNPDA